MHPERVPQMADAEALIERLPDVDGVSFIGLIMNKRGLDRALDTRVHKIGMVVVASDTYNRGGIGGCPFAPAATGNIPADDLLYMLDRSGIETGVSLKRIIAVSDWLAAELGRGVPAMLPKAGIFPRQ